MTPNVSRPLLDNLLWPDKCDGPRREIFTPPCVVQVGGYSAPTMIREDGRLVHERIHYGRTHGFAGYA